MPRNLNSLSEPSRFFPFLNYEGADLRTRWREGGFLDERVQFIRRVYRERRDVMLEAMEKHFPAGGRWTRPQGGLFLWVTLPEEMDSADLLRAAIEREVGFIPGAPFYTCGGGGNTLRLNFSNAAPE